MTTPILFIILFVLSIISFANLVRLTLKPAKVLRKKWIEMFVSAFVSLAGIYTIFLLWFINFIEQI